VTKTIVANFLPLHNKKNQLNNQTNWRVFPKFGGRARSMDGGKRIL